jgi:type II secretory pathway component PulJ
MYKRKNKNPGGWPKLLHKLSRLVSRMRSQASADIAIAQAERAVRRKIKAAGAVRGTTTEGKNA